MKILVTGAAGFIGSHVCEALLARGDFVFGIDNFDPYYSRSIKNKNLSGILSSKAAEFREVDILDAEAISNIMTSFRPDSVIHLAARAGVRPSIEDPLGYLRTNVEGTNILLEACRKNGIDLFLFASSSSVYGNNEKVPFSESDFVDNPISPYAATKKACELVAHTYSKLFNMRIAALRFFTVFGPRQRPDLAISKFSSLMLQGKPIPFYGDGSSERDYTYIDDIVMGILSSLSYISGSTAGTFEVFNLGESKTTSLSHLVQLLESTLQAKAILEKKPSQPGDVKRTFADISKARSMLGYAPVTNVKDGLVKYAEWLARQNQI